jgi:two-component system, OmpR family, response regulator TctD
MGQRPAASARKVLIIEDDSAIRNLLYVLLASMGCEGEVAHDGRQALAMIRRQDYDAILLDLRCYNLYPENVLEGLKEIRPSLLGRVLAITGEVSSPGSLAFFTRLSMPQISKSRLIEELLPRLHALLSA